MRRLTEKQQLYCKYRFTLGSKTFDNGTASYMRAYPNCKSEKAASVRVAELVDDSRVLAEKQRIQKEMNDEINITRDDVIKDLKTIKDDAKSERDKISALSLISDLCGFKRESAPNKEREADLGRRLAMEQEKVRDLQYIANKRVEDIAHEEQEKPNIKLKSG